MKRLCDALRKKARRWREQEDGATAVEFALIATVFFWVFMGIVELGMMMIFSGGLEDGVDKVARLVRTGQADNTGLGAADMRKTICGQVVLKTSCEKELVLDIRSFPDFASVSLAKPTTDEDGKPKLAVKYDIGGAKKVVVVRAYYPWKFFTPLIGNLMKAVNGRTFILSAATAFRNEPYGA